MHLFKHIKRLYNDQVLRRRYAEHIECNYNPEYNAYHAQMSISFNKYMHFKSDTIGTIDSFGLKFFPGINDEITKNAETFPPFVRVYDNERDKKIMGMKKSRESMRD